ncbi:hypothetical protein [Methanobrevibacter woesei]|uniref:hypothetical protein n=1 Tax=Methanobrevibacter woesei TaxID=190976 RepID=UPI0024B67821|nr:hypothetical protein [Methanobrevibacter woesei]
MSFKSKMIYNAGSMKTVIPAGLVQLLQYEAGDSLNWEVDITENGAEVKITRIPKEE